MTTGNRPRVRAVSNFKSLIAIGLFWGSMPLVLYYVSGGIEAWSLRILSALPTFVAVTLFGYVWEQLRKVWLTPADSSLSAMDQILFGLITLASIAASLGISFLVLAA